MAKKMQRIRSQEESTNPVINCFSKCRIWHEQTQQSDSAVVVRIDATRQKHPGLVFPADSNPFTASIGSTNPTPPKSTLEGLAS